MKKSSKIALGLSTVALAGVAALTPVLVTAWGDSANGRPTYTQQQIREGALKDTITFNSISDGSIGNELYFVGAKPNSEVADSNILWKNNEIEVQDGETYTIRLYVHNNNAPTEEEYQQGKGGATATGVRVNFSLPTTVGTKLPAIGYITAPNATPNKYWDEVYFVSDSNFYLEYVEDSAKYVNNAGTFKLPNDVVVGAGALIGYDKMDGNIPGCFNYDGTVYIQVTAHKSVTASLQKKVRIKGTKDWSESVDAKVGDEVEYQIEYVNLANTVVNDVIIRDILPTNVEYVAGSTKLYNSNHQDGVAVPEETLTTSGINIGNHDPKANSYVRFTGKVIDKSLACGDNQLVNWANSTSDGAVTAKDDASVMVAKECKPDEPVTPDTPTLTPTPTPSQPSVETPTTIVATGPAEIATGALGVGSTVSLLGYYLASRKKLG